MEDSQVGHQSIMESMDPKAYKAAMGKLDELEKILDKENVQVDQFLQEYMDEEASESPEEEKSEGSEADEAGSGMGEAGKNPTKVALIIARLKKKPE